MKERELLKSNTDIRFTNHAGGEMHYVVGEVIGKGGSCLVYDGYYINNAGTKTKIGRASVGKECDEWCRSRWSPYH